MQARVPASRGRFRLRLSLFDTGWAIAAPLAALYFRDAQIFSWERFPETIIYVSISFAISLVAFAALRIHDSMSRYFSVRDAISVAKAVTITAVLTLAALFTITRLDGIPRLVPLIHALILGAGLVAARTLARVSESERHQARATASGRVEHILMVGTTRLTALYIKFLEEYSPHQHRIMGILDDRPHMLGRNMEGRPIVGPTQHLAVIIEEFQQHGIHIDRVIVGDDFHIFTDDQLASLRRICALHSIRFQTVPDLIGLSKPAPPPATEEATPLPAPPPIPLPAYFTLKRVLDFGIALSIVAFFPLWAPIWLVALLDVGSPVLFWQQRVGQRGRTFLLYKIRTLQPPFDANGEPIPEEDRLSPVGRFLRRFRLDELPQVLNVLVGEMSLIGPRPLLPIDQPADPSVRLQVRPGITGWAQINGGTDLTPEEKDAMDEWYIRNASLWLDVRIMIRTFLFFSRGQHRDEHAIAEAMAARAGDHLQGDPFQDENLHEHVQDEQENTEGHSDTARSESPKMQPDKVTREQVGR